MRRQARLGCKLKFSKISNNSEAYFHEHPKLGDQDRDGLRIKTEKVVELNVF